MTTESLPTILAESFDSLERGELTLEQCLSAYPEYRDELQALLTVAWQLQAAPEVDPSPAFQRQARSRLLKQLPPREVRAPHGTHALRPAKRRQMIHPLREMLGWLWQNFFDSFEPRRFVRQWLAVLLVVVLLFSGGTLAYASNSSLPGDGLYPVKRALEEARLAVSFTQAGDAALRLEFATHRLDEASALLGEHRADEATQSLQAYTEEMELARASLQSLTNAEARALTATVNQTAARNEAALQTIAAQAPVEAEPALIQALTISAEIQQEVLESPTPAPPDSGPSNFYEPQPTALPPQSSPAEPESAPPSTAPSDPPQPTALPPTSPPPSGPGVTPLEIVTSSSASALTEPAPTESAPAEAPIVEPTLNPTEMPSPELTLAPTESPTPALTESPSPSPAPTESAPLETSTSEPTPDSTGTPATELPPTPIPTEATPTESAPAESVPTESVPTESAPDQTPTAEATTAPTETSAPAPTGPPTTEPSPPAGPTLDPTAPLPTPADPGETTAPDSAESPTLEPLPSTEAAPPALEAVVLPAPEEAAPPSPAQ